MLRPPSSGSATPALFLGRPRGAVHLLSTSVSITLTKTLARQPGPILPSEQPHRASEANLVQSSAPRDGSLHGEQPAGGSCGQSDKLRGLEHPRLSCSSGGQRSDIALCRLKSRCRQGLSPSGNSRGESVPLPFQLLETAYVPCPVASHHSKLIVRSPSPPLTPRVSLTGTPVSPGLGAFQNDPGWLPHVRGLNFVTSVMSLFSCKVTVRVLELRTGSPGGDGNGGGGGHYSVHHSAL